MLQERWQELHRAEGDQRFAAAQHLLAEVPRHQVCWLFEWLAGAVFNKKTTSVPKEGFELLCDVLDALPEKYPLHSHVPWLLALPLREPLMGSALLERLLKRPMMAFHPSMEQAMPIFQKMSLSESSLRLLLRSLESASPKKAFRHVLEALPALAGGACPGPEEGRLLAVLVQPPQLPGFEVLTANWEAGNERQAGTEVYQAQVFSCLTKMMAEEPLRSGACRLLVTFFAELVNAFARQRAKEQVRQEREKLEEKPKTSVEFLVMIQLWNILKPWVKDTNCGAAVESLQQLWQMIRRFGLYRPREDPKGLQSKTLGSSCVVLLKRMESCSTHSIAEWACLEELLELDVAPFESRLQRVWSLSSGDLKAAPLAAKLLKSYALLADLSSCLEALNDATKQKGGSSPLLSSPEFVQGLEEAASQLTAPGQIAGTWKMLLKSLQVSAVDAAEGSMPSAAALLRPFLAGVKPTELSLKHLTELFHETYDWLLGIEPWPNSLDGVLLSLCILGRKLSSWELPPLLAEPSSTSQRSREGLERLAKGSFRGEAAAPCLLALRDAGAFAKGEAILEAAIQQVEYELTASPSAPSAPSAPSTASSSRVKQPLARRVAMLAGAACASPKARLGGRKRRRKQAGAEGDDGGTLEGLCALLLPEDAEPELLLANLEALLESKVLREALLQRLHGQLQEQVTKEPKGKRRRRGGAATASSALVARLQVLRRLVGTAVPMASDVLSLLRSSVIEADDPQVRELALMCLAELLPRTALEGEPEEAFNDLEQALRRIAKREVSQDLARALGACTKSLRRTAQGKVTKHSLTQWIAPLIGADQTEDGTLAPLRWKTPTPLSLLQGAKPPPELPRLLAFLEGGSLSKLDGVLELKMSDLQDNSAEQKGDPDDALSRAENASQLLQLLSKDVQLQTGDGTKVSWISCLPEVLRWMKEHPGPHLRPLTATLARELERLCKVEDITATEALMDILLTWSQLPEDEEDVNRPERFACLEFWAKRSELAEKLVERLSLQICSAPSETASLRPLGSALARLMRGMGRSASATFAIVAAQRLLGAAEDTHWHALLLSAGELLLALYTRVTQRDNANRRGKSTGSDQRAPHLSHLEALLLSAACANSVAAGDGSNSPTEFSALMTSASNLLSALFKAVPLEGVRLPVWVERPHLLQDAFRPMLEAVYAAPTGALARAVAQDLARHWEALSQGGARQSVQSGGRTGLTTYQAKVQRVTKGFALPLLSHALEQQRRFDGAEAAAKRRRVAGGNRAEEVATWKETVAVLQQGLATLLTLLDGADHLLQGLYASLREPLRSMFKELHGGWQKHGRYQGET